MVQVYNILYIWHSSSINLYCFGSCFYGVNMSYKRYKQVRPVKTRLIDIKISIKNVFHRVKIKILDIIDSIAYIINV